MAWRRRTSPNPGASLRSPKNSSAWNGVNVVVAVGIDGVAEHVARDGCPVDLAVLEGLRRRRPGRRRSAARSRRGGPGVRRAATTWTRVPSASADSTVQSPERSSGAWRSAAWPATSTMPYDGRGQQLREDRQGRRQSDLHRAGIDRPQAADLGRRPVEERPEADDVLEPERGQRRVSAGHDVLQGADHLGGGHGPPAGEGRAGAQREAPGLEPLVCGPGLGQGGDGRPAVVELGQPIVEQVRDEHRRRIRDRRCCWVEGERAADADAQRSPRRQAGLRRPRRGGRSRHRRRRCRRPPRGPRPRRAGPQEPALPPHSNVNPRGRRGRWW